MYIQQHVACFTDPEVHHVEHCALCVLQADLKVHDMCVQPDQEVYDLCVQHYILCVSESYPGVHHVCITA